MTHPLHSDYCKCECDQLAEKIKRIISLWQPSTGWMLLQDALDNICRCDMDDVAKNNGIHPIYCGKS
jgi:hypothetical protein